MELEPFEEIVARHGPTVLRVCRAVLGPAAAEDAWSETFLSALQAYPQLRAGSNVEAWLVTIAHRKAIDQVRAAARRPVPAGDLPERPSRDGVPDGTDQDLWDALKDLPLKQRASVAYHYLAGLPYAEIAGILGGSADAARRAAADGIAALRKVYRPVAAAPGPATAEHRRSATPGGASPMGSTARTPAADEAASVASGEGK